MIAVQGFGLRKEFDSDLTGTIRRLHEIGFDGIEPLILFQQSQGKMPRNTWAQDTLKTAWETMRELGMTISSAHLGVGFGWFTMPAGTVIKGMLQLHETYGIRNFVLTAPFGSVAQAKHWAALAKKAAEAVKPYGCRILYHNHDDEFYTLRGGNTAMDVFLANTSPDVLLQIDIGWAGMAGDEAEIVRKYGDRLHTLHLKDFYGEYRGRYTRKNMPKEAFAPIGEGAIKTEEIIRYAKTLPGFSGTCIIDQDNSTRDMLEDLKTGFGNIQSFLQD